MVQMPNIDRVRTEIVAQLKIAIPTSLSSVVYKIPWLISTAFVGRIGADELAAAALASSLCNVTGLSLALGLSSAVTTLAGQSKGEMDRRRKLMQNSQINNVTNNYNTSIDEEKKIDVQDYESIQKDSENNALLSNKPSMLYPMTPKTYFYRGIFILFIFMLPVGIYWIYGIKSLLIYLGQNDRIANMTQQYLRILTPGMWSYSINFTLTSWLQAIGMADVPMYGGLVGLACHIPMNIFFIYTLEWGYEGAAAATSVFQILQPVVTFLYLYITNHGRSRVYYNTGADTLASPIPLSFDIKRAIFSYKGIYQYLGLALPGVLLISEWWASETAIFLAGLLSSPAIALAGMSIYQSINSTCFMFVVGVGVACAARVANLLGARDANGASFASGVSIILAVITGLMLALTLYFTPHVFFPSFFTPDVAIIGEVAATIPYLSIYVFADGLQYTISGIMKGCGRQCSIAPVVIVAYWLVGLPLGYFLTFRWQYGTDNINTEITGLVLGMTLGTCIHSFLLAMITIFTTNWDKEIKKSQSRMELEHETNLGSSKEFITQDYLSAKEGKGDLKLLLT